MYRPTLPDRLPLAIDSPITCFKRVSPAAIELHASELASSSGDSSDGGSSDDSGGSDIAGGGDGTDDVGPRQGVEEAAAVRLDDMAAGDATEEEEQGIGTILWPMVRLGPLNARRPAN